MSDLPTQAVFMCGRTLPLTETTRRPESNSACSICTEQLSAAHLADVVVLLDCGHFFHTVCICSWLTSTNQRRNTCPNCRHTLCLYEPDRLVTPPDTDRYPGARDRYRMTHRPARVGVATSYGLSPPLRAERRRYRERVRLNRDPENASRDTEQQHDPSSEQSTDDSESSESASEDEPQRPEREGTTMTHERTLNRLRAAVTENPESLASSLQASVPESDSGDEFLNSYRASDMSSTHTRSLQRLAQAEASHARLAADFDRLQSRVEDLAARADELATNSRRRRITSRRELGDSDV